MPWFDETTEINEADLKDLFPVNASDDLRFSEDGKKLAIVNDFPRGTKLYDLADPRAEDEDSDHRVFYHVFLGHDAAAAESAISTFMSEADLNDCGSVTLYRKEDDLLFAYANGYICVSLLSDQAGLRAILPETLHGEEVFILPLKRFMHKCPVCGYRTLLSRGSFEICGECGWEDEGVDDDDAEQPFGANGDCTIRKYREEYLSLKADDPQYSWRKSLNR